MPIFSRITRSGAEIEGRGGAANKGFLRFPCDMARPQGRDGGRVG